MRKLDRGTARSKGTLKRAGVSFGTIGYLLLVIALVLSLSALFASYTQQPQLGSQAISPTATIDQIAITPPAAQVNWQTYTDKELNFSIQYPVSWYKLDTSRLRQPTLRCFGARPGSVTHNSPQFCVEFEPWVRVDDRGFTSNSYEAQQQFFESLNEYKVGQPRVSGAQQYLVTQRYQLAGAPAVERIETLAPGAETESFYGVSVYVNHPKFGLIRLSMGAVDREQFEQHENDLRRMLESFSLLRK